MARAQDPSLRPSAEPLPRLGLFLLVGINLVWGLNWPLLRIGLEALPPFTFRALMIPLAGVLLLALARLLRQALAVPREMWVMLAVSGLLNVAGWHVFSAFGVLHMESGRAAVVGFTMPLWAAVLARIFLGERLTARRMLALGLGMAGIAALLGGDLAGLRADPLGPLYMVGAAVCWAGGTLVQKQVRWGAPVLVLTGWQMLIAGLPLVIAALAFESVPHNPFTPQVIGVLAFFVFGPLGFCYGAWYKVVSLFPTTVAALSTLMIPVIGVVSGALVHDEPLGLSEVSALVLVCSGIALVLTAPARPAAAD